VLDWLLDNYWIAYLIFASAGAALGIAWWKTRKKHFAFGVGVVAALLGVYIVLQCLIETDMTRLKRHVNEMGQSVKDRQIKSVLEKSLSDDFQVGIHHKYNKREFIGKAEALQQAFNVTSLSVWNIEIIEIDRSNGIAKVNFNARPHVPDTETKWYLVKAEYVMTPKEHWWQPNEWKMKTFQYSDGVVNTAEPLEIP
jgi:hypothetical protein